MPAAPAPGARPSRSGRTLLLDAVFRLTGVRDRLDLAPLLDGLPVEIIDVGARGGFHERWNQLGASLRISLFEPDDAAYEALRGQYAGDARVRLFHSALSEHGEPLTIHVTAWPASSSAFQHDQHFFSPLNFRKLYAEVGTVRVDSARLADLATWETDFIKLDVEGCELAALRGAGRTIDSCIGIEAEVSYAPWGQGLPVFGDVDRFCRESGFVLTALGPLFSYHYLLPDPALESHGVTFSGDALYFRSPARVLELVADGRWKAEKIVKALSIYLAYGSAEFAHVLLRGALDRELLSRSDRRVAICEELIAQRSGFGKMVPYRTIRRLKRLLGLPLGLDY